MTTNYHTAVAHGAEATHDVVNAPLSQLDTQITADHAEIVAARGSMGAVDTRLDVSLNENGTIKTSAVSITAQSQVSLASAAVAGGDAVRYDEFSAYHTAATGVHPVAAATGMATRYDEFTVEHDADGTHRDGVIIVAYMNSDVLSGTGNTGARPAAAKSGYLYWDTQTKQILRDTGAAFVEMTGTITATNVTDLTDGGLTTLHYHTRRYQIWAQASVQAADNTAAPALQILQKDDTNNTACIVARISFYKTPEIEALTLRGTYLVDAGGTNPRIHIGEGVGGVIVTITPTADGAGHHFEQNVDIAAFTDDTTYEIQVSLQWLTADGGAHDIKASNLSLFAEASGAPS